MDKNRLKTAVVDAEITICNYYPDGKKDTINYPNGTYAKYTYHASNRVDTVANKLTSDGSIISSYTYVYDQNGNRTFQNELQNGANETTTYNYDSVDRMTDFTVDDGANTTLNEYTFEGYNRKTEAVTENSTVIKDRTYNYDETNWLTTVQSSEFKVQSSITYTYDNNGNTVLKSDSSLPNDDTTFTYDSRNQLVETKRGPPGSETVLGQYDYNSDGLRVRHRLSERGDVDYYYDENAVIEEHNASDDSLLAHYRYADRLLSLDTGVATQYYHFDALGSTVNLTTETASVQVSYKLDPWGHIRSQTGTSVNKQIFTGQEHDENTGLIYFGSRYYDPDTARFITQDSYLGESSTPPSLHRYLYAYSNPTVYVDLYGYAADEAVEQEDVNEQASMGSYMRKGLQSYNDIMMGQENLRALSHYSYGLFSGAEKLCEATYMIVRHPVGTTVALGEGIGKLTWRLTEEPEKVKNDIAEWWKKVESDPDKLSMMTGEVVSGIASGYGVSKAVSTSGQFIKSTSAFQGVSRTAGSIKSKLPGVLFDDVGQIALKSVRHGPMNPGPLADDIANTFRSGTYTAKTVDKPTTMYRVISDTGNPTGSYWTRVEPKGPLQSVIDSALDQNWGNTATRVVKAEIPAGTKIYEGATAAQRGLVGGGNQVYIPKVDPKWIAP